MKKISYALIAEDNPGDVFLLKEVLRDFTRSLKMIWVEDGAEAIAWLDNRLNHPSLYSLDFALLDLNLPRYSGLDVLRRIRTDRVLSGTPVVIMSSSDNERDREAAERLGANAYFHKPSDFGSYMDLEKLLGGLSGKRHEGESLARSMQFALRNAPDRMVNSAGALLDGASFSYKQIGNDPRASSGPARGYVPRRQTHGAWTFRRRRKFIDARAGETAVGLVNSPSNGAHEGWSGG